MEKYLRDLPIKLTPKVLLSPPWERMEVRGDKMREITILPRQGGGYYFVVFMVQS
jgi:hypothetical protein